MAYIGKISSPTTYTSRLVDTMTGDGSDTTLTLSETPKNVCVYIDGVFQKPSVEYNIANNVITFTTAPGVNCNVVALHGGGETIAVPADGSVTSDDILDNAITSSKVVSMDAAKLTGDLPELDGSSLTGITGGVLIKNASDPAIDTNPSGGVGTLWVNTTSGQVYILTDATAGSNVWINVGTGSDDVEPYSFQGSIAGYESGGHGFGTKVDKFSFITDSDSTTVASLYESKKRATATPSSTHGYTAGNYSPNGNVIEKMAYASDSDGSYVGDLNVARGRSCSQASATNGYMSSGGDNPSHVAIYERYSFISDDNAINIGNINSKREAPSGHSSTIHGYVSKGYGGSPATARTDRERFSFASDSTITTMNGLATANHGSGGSCSSSTHGYHVGGGVTNIIDKYSFATDAIATDVGDLQASKYLVNGTSSATDGYGSGGYPNNGNIEKFSFSSGTQDASTIGSLTGANYGGAGHQV